ncbi:MAG TPA: hypothetical protein VGP47_08315 [Parachlamydiaceae bacterium]|nr:hypothetical protein [Parachlamydiaceae bacterium]
MKFLKHLAMLAVVAGSFATSGLYADDRDDNSRFDEELNERDFDALRDYLKSKRVADIEESTSSLTISGDVRTEYRHLNESCKGQRLRGISVKPGVLGRERAISRNDFDIEFNLRFDYVGEKTWASAQVRYDNSAGVDDNGHPCGPVKNPIIGCCGPQARQCIGDPEGFHGSGNCDDLCLKRAYMGYELYSCGNSRMFFELGRRGSLYNVFDSNIQFLSRFDGLLLKYESKWNCVGDWYVQAAGFVVDEKVNHFAWVAEAGLLNIANSGIDLKYSVIDWEKHGRNRCGARDPRGFRFINSQFTAAYNWDTACFGQYLHKTFIKKTSFYGAFLVNHAARNFGVKKLVGYDGNDDPIYNTKYHGKQNIGWYAGVLFGKVRKEGDWAIEVQYQSVQAQAVPDRDVAGICRGNILDESITTCSYRGNTNYKGWRVQGLYAFTDNLTLDSIIEWSKAENEKIGGAHTYSKMELEAIYAF